MSELKACNLSFLNATHKLQQGERVSGSSIRGMWTDLRKVLKKVPAKHLKSLKTSIDEPDLEASKGMLNAVLVAATNRVDARNSFKGNDVRVDFRWLI